jgi:hypothetical protein
MARSYVVENNRSRERLKKLVDGVTDDELKLVIYKEGWTVAAALGHLAFWDQYSLLLMRKWKDTGVVTPIPLDWDTINDRLMPNDTVLPFLLAIAPRTAADLAVSCAEAIDRELEEAPPGMIDRIRLLEDRTRL